MRLHEGKLQLSQLKSDIITNSERSYIQLKDGINIYEVIKERKDVCDTSQAQEIIFWPCQHKEMETFKLMLIGETGKGKTSLINGMINYIMGVDYCDVYRFSIPIHNLNESKCDVDSQTEQITVHSIPYVDGMHYKNHFAIIDTPGLLDTRGLTFQKENMEQLKLFIKNHDIMETLFIGIVTECNYSKDCNTKSLLDGIKSIIGELSNVKIISIATFADMSIPTCYSIIEDHGIKLDHRCKIDNSIVFRERKLGNDDLALEWNSWKKGVGDIMDYMTNESKEIPVASLNEPEQNYDMCTFPMVTKDPETNDESINYIPTVYDDPYYTNVSNYVNNSDYQNEPRSSALMVIDDPLYENVQTRYNSTLPDNFHSENEKRLYRSTVAYNVHHDNEQRIFSPTVINNSDYENECNDDSIYENEIQTFKTTSDGKNWFMKKLLHTRRFDPFRPLPMVPTTQLELNVNYESHQANSRRTSCTTNTFCTALSTNDIGTDQIKEYEIRLDDIRIRKEAYRTYINTLAKEEKFVEEKLVKLKEDEEMKIEIQIFCRIRPLNDLELNHSGDKVVTEVGDDTTLRLKTASGTKSFSFDHIYQQNEDQNAVFCRTKKIIQSSLEGYNVTIIAYGQTGTGKTYTMLGEINDTGIAPRTFKKLFQFVDDSRHCLEVEVSTYMIEVYNGMFIDLLNKKGYNERNCLKMNHDEKGVAHVEGETIHVNNAEEMLKVFYAGLKNSVSKLSSPCGKSYKSHLVFTICLKVKSKPTGHIFRCKITLVDLAGRESVKKSNAFAEYPTKSNSVNNSLTALSDVLSAISSKAPEVPYRNSKLTMLLQDSLSGKSRTLVIVHASPSVYNVKETLSYFMCASRMKNNNAVIKKTKKRQKDTSKLKKVIQKLRKEDFFEAIQYMNENLKLPTMVTNYVE